MARPVEINRKKTRLLWLAVVWIGLTAWQVWGNYDNLMSFTWKAIPNLLFAAIPAFSGLVALALLLHSLFKREPYLLVYDDHIEIDRPMNRNFWVLHLSDVKDLTSEGDGDKKKLIAPAWSADKISVLGGIDKHLAELDTWQGKLYKPEQV